MFYIEQQSSASYDCLSCRFTGLFSRPGYKFNVTVCHYPPGTSKWNVIEHRLFSEISKNWRGTPLIDYETVLKYTTRTKTKTGLKVNAVLVEKIYQKGLKASEEDLNNLNIVRHEVNTFGKKP